MKKIIMMLLTLCIFSMHLQGQTSTENYVKTYKARVPVSGTLDATAYRHKDSVKQHIQYFDGMGRGKQDVLRWGTPNGKDIISLMIYDDFGRQAKTYLPYADNAANGAIRSNPVTAQQDFFDQYHSSVLNAGTYALSEKQLEDSPLGRVLKQGAPGQVWQVDGNHTVDYDYRPNTISDGVKSLKVTSGNTIVIGQDYPENELWAVQTSDENNGANEGIITEFSDKRGRVVLRKVKETSTTDLSTYYVFDQLDRIRFIIPPAAVVDIVTNSNWNQVNDDDFQQKWMFCYRYDAKGRMTAKREPGADWIHMIYDKRDRLVLIQEGNQRVNDVEQVDGQLTITGYQGKNYNISGTGSLTISGPTKISANFTAGPNVTSSPNRWIFTKYDAFDRPVMEGYYYDNDTPALVQAKVEASTDFSAAFTDSGPLAGYDATSFPTTATSEDLLTVTYYDSYGFNDISSIQPSGVNLQVKGLVTGGKVKVLESDQWLETTVFYDDRYRPIKVITGNHKNGNDAMEFEYENKVSALVSATTSTHTSDDYSGALQIRETFTYDHQDRLLQHTHQVNNETAVILVDNSFSEIGELRSKQIGDNVQQIDYRYNTRGWLTSINGGGSAPLVNGDLFAMQLEYDAAGQYNGNIGRMNWRSGGGPSQNKQQFDYTYDAMSRLTSADYSSSGQNGYFDIDNLEYDANGNILKLDRYQGVNSSRKLIDALTYQYTNGNQLSSVVDAGDASPYNPAGVPHINKVADLGFKDGTNSGDDYSYDPNGNTVEDLNKGITNIVYNHLNLPEVISFDNGDQVAYVYNAKGSKLQKEATISGVTTVTDYIAGKHYNNGTLNFFQHAEGRVVKQGSNWGYEYNIKDHLGNIRVSVDDNGTVVQKDDYYPFGLTFNSWSPSRSGGENLYKYNGVELDRNLQLYETRYRGYDASLGRFMQIDPLTSLMPSINAYQFGFNNPIRFNDPTGLCPDCNDFGGSVGADGLTTEQWMEVSNPATKNREQKERAYKKKNKTNERNAITVDKIQQKLDDGDYSA